jgi:hypothetical protein
VEGDEADYVMHIEKIGSKYLHGKFIFDFIVLLPLGFLGSIYNKSYGLLHLIKAARVNRFLRFFKPSFYMPQIRRYYQNKLNNVLKNEQKKNNIIEQNNFILARAKARNYMNSLVVLLSMIISTYLSSIIWFLVISSDIDESKSEEITFVSYFNLHQRTGY